MYRLAGTKMEPNLPATSEYPPIGVEANAVEADKTHLVEPIRYRLMRFTHPENATDRIFVMAGRLTSDNTEQFANA